jgi:hypothetical protein
MRSDFFLNPTLCSYRERNVRSVLVWKFDLANALLMVVKFFNVLF